jgi:hypothetical protein
VLSALLATQWVAVGHGAGGHGRHRAADSVVQDASASVPHGVSAVALAHDWTLHREPMLATSPSISALSRASSS